MGESKKDALRVKFDKKLKLEFHGVKVTSDAGLLAFRELDEALGLTAMIESDFCDNRKGRNTQHNIIALLRQSIYSRLAGYEDTNDAERLSVDPAMRQIVGERANSVSVSRKLFWTWIVRTALHMVNRKAQFITATSATLVIIRCLSLISSVI